MTDAVIVAGASVVDRFITLPHLPREGVTEVATGATICPGGKGLNQAVGLARLGLKTHFLSAVGRDADGLWLTQELKNEGINPPLKLDGPTGFSNILVEESSGRHVLGTYRGANDNMNFTTLPRKKWGAFRAGLFQWETDDDVNLHIARALIDAGKTVILNPAPVPDPAMIEPWCELNPLITPNEIEATRLTGLKRFTPDTAVKRLRRLGFSRGVITLGSKGVVLWEGSHIRIQKARRVRAVDCVGAGDSFNAGLLWGLLTGQSLRAACRTGQACAALTVSRPGTMAALPTRQELKL